MTVYGNHSSGYRPKVRGREGRGRLTRRRQCRLRLNESTEKWTEMHPFSSTKVTAYNAFVNLRLVVGLLSDTKGTVGEGDEWRSLVDWRFEPTDFFLQETNRKDLRLSFRRVQNMTMSRTYWRVHVFYVYHLKKRIETPPVIFIKVTSCRKFKITGVH